MLFKLISDGLNTRIELDGKRINGCHLVNFAHRRDKDGNDCRVTLELDLENRKAHVPAAGAGLSRMPRL